MSSINYAIELYFDPSLENQVLKSWNTLARRQISTQLIEIESRPHITLFTTPQFLNPSKLQTLIKTLASKHAPLALNFNSIGFLPDREGESNVLFLSPTPTLPLLQLHSQLCDLLRKEGIEIGDGFRVDCWVPFCPVAQEMGRDRMGEGFGVLKDMKMPVCGFGVDIGLVEFSPVRELCCFALGDSVEV